MAFQLYCLDTETTGLDYQKHSIIELSIFRFSDESQRTWCLQPKSFDIEKDALRINHHKLDDLKHLTKFGRETYLDPKKALPEIENWFMEDGSAPEDRVLVAQNASYDLSFIMEFWKREGAQETFPFGNRPLILDTRQIALFLDLVFDRREEYYSLGTLIQRYGIKNTKAHTAAADTLATKLLLEAQIASVKGEEFKKSLKKK